MENISPEQFDKFIEALECLGWAIVFAALIRGFLNE